MDDDVKSELDKLFNHEWTHLGPLPDIAWEALLTRGSFFGQRPMTKEEYDRLRTTTDPEQTGVERE